MTPNARFARPTCCTRDALRGRRLRWADGEGRGVSIDDSGSLLGELDDGRTLSLGSGEVLLLH